MKIVRNIQLKIVIFTAVKNRCILHGRVFVMFMCTLNEKLIVLTFFKWAILDVCCD